MKPTDVLRHEHEVILLVVEAAKKVVEKIEQEDRLDLQKARKLMEFFSNFADKCHHAKEEKLLFPLMQDRGIPKEGGPIGVMLKEHEDGRAFIKGATEALKCLEAGQTKSNPLAVFRVNLKEYIELITSHIDKEDNILFPMAENIFAEDDEAELLRAFEKVEKEDIGAGVHEKFHKLAHELAED